MKSLNKDIGKYGEDIAFKFLKYKNYKILKRNYRNRFGEIDFICTKNDILSFIEVKTRYFNNFGTPCESVNLRKKKNIIFMSKFFLTEHTLNHYFIRYDIIEIFLNLNSDKYKILFTKDAFRLDDL